MFFSRLKLDAESRQTRMLIIYPYQLHKAIYFAFPNKDEGGTGRILYRMDINKNNNITLLVQSEKKPEWDSAELMSNCLLETPSVKSVSLSFRENQSLYFRLRANPVAKRATPDNPQTRRMGLLREQDQIAWLERKAVKGGFKIVNCRAMPEGIVKSDNNENTSGKSKKISHYAVLFEGILKVTEPELFLQSISNGIGPAKGFGFGLLSVAPLKE